MAKVPLGVSNIIIDRDREGRFIKGCMAGKLNKGKKRTNEFKKNVSKFHTGKHHSEETKKILSLKKLGSLNPMFKNKRWIGKKHKLESKIKISCAKRKIKREYFKGFVSRTAKTGYYSTQYKQWRLKVFIRDNFICQGCKRVGGYLTAHHIKSWANYPKLRFIVSNGITLCEDCHKLTDNYKGKNKGGG